MFRNVSAREDIKENSKTTLLQLEDYFRLHIFVTYFTPCSWYSSIRLDVILKLKPCLFCLVWLKIGQENEIAYLGSYKLTSPSPNPLVQRHPFLFNITSQCVLLLFTFRCFIFSMEKLPFFRFIGTKNSKSYFPAEKVFIYKYCCDVFQPKNWFLLYRRTSFRWI